MLSDSAVYFWHHFSILTLLLTHPLVDHAEEVRVRPSYFLVLHLIEHTAIMISYILFCAQKMREGDGPLGLARPRFTLVILVPLIGHLVSIQLDSFL